MLSTSESFVSAESAYRRERVAAEVSGLRRRPGDHTNDASASHGALALRRVLAVLRAQPALSG